MWTTWVGGTLFHMLVIVPTWSASLLISYQVIVSLIAATTTVTGLRVNATLDTNPYPAGVNVRDADLQGVNYKPARFHGDWNYTISPK
jgi:hypothetical protein